MVQNGPREKGKKRRKKDKIVLSSLAGQNKRLVLNVSMSGQRNVITRFQNHPVTLKVSVCVYVCACECVPGRVQGLFVQIKRETGSLERRCKPVTLCLHSKIQVHCSWSKTGRKNVSDSVFISLNMFKENQLHLEVTTRHTTKTSEVTHRVNYRHALKRTEPNR